ncbi:MAG: hypothetical protein A2138_18300 [Deltaproteobacteria bacterium RBG_16_71_12]|nr:MAG: hypothetical protein A2138_18300 [Deltaproteobacteria bacterium RBG_16_71_12]
MVIALALASSVLAAGAVSVGGERPSDEVVTFLDGGALRVVERAGPGQGVFVDPGSGRRARVRFGDAVIVALPAGDAERAQVLAELSIVVTRELSRRLHLGWSRARATTRTRSRSLRASRLRSQQGCSARPTPTWRFVTG